MMRQVICYHIKKGVEIMDYYERKEKSSCELAELWWRLAVIAMKIFAVYAAVMMIYEKIV